MSEASTAEVSTAARAAPAVAVVSAAWGIAGDEAAFAARVLAGAASRLGPVDVLGPWDPGQRADGAFDPQGVGRPEPGQRWPSPSRVAWPESAVASGSGTYRAVLIDAGDAEAVALAAAFVPDVPVLSIGGLPLEGMAACLDLVPVASATSGHHPVGLNVPVHSLAADHAHLELGSVTDYLLVLSGRPPETADPLRPPDDVAWLVTRYPRRPVVLVENAVASVWRSRSCVHRFGIHTRMDLWRLMAHARATVDLGPGHLFGRECVESVRYGVPVVVPAGSGADALAAAGAGLCFRGTAGLLEAVGAVEDRAALATLRDAGASLERWFGEPGRLVDRLSEALEHPNGPGTADG